MQVGTYVIVVSTILLPIVGPGIQEGQNAQYLLSKGYAIVWSLILLGGMLGSSIYVFSLTPWTRISKQNTYLKFIILLIARSTCFTLNLTASRVFILQPGITLIILSIIIKIVSGAIYTWAICVQSTEVVQTKFVPLNATTLMLVNGITGIIIWEDWRVVESWVGYVCVFMLLGLASYLLLSSTPLLTSENPEYGQRAHFRRGQLSRSRASRTFNQYDLGSLSSSDSEDSSCFEQDDGDKSQSSHGNDDNVSESSNHDNVSESSISRGKEETESTHESKIVDGHESVQEDEENKDDTAPTEKDHESNDVEDQSTPPTRPRLERVLTKREAWQSIYHLNHPKTNKH